MAQMIQVGPNQWINPDNVLLITEHGPDRSAVLMVGGVTQIVPLSGKELSETLSRPEYDVSGPTDIELFTTPQVLPEGMLEELRWLIEQHKKKGPGGKLPTPKGNRPDQQG